MSAMVDRHMCGLILHGGAGSAGVCLVAVSHSYRASSGCGLLCLSHVQLKTLTYCVTQFLQSRGLEPFLVRQYSQACSTRYGAPKLKWDGSANHVVASLRVEIHDSL